MRVSRHSPAAAAILVALFGAASASASTPFDLAECLNTKAAALARLAACGNAASIEYCLANRMPKESQLCTSEVLAPCFVDAGCQPDEALIEAAWTIKRCQDGGNGDVEELRRRSKPKDVRAPLPTPTPAPAPANAAAALANARRAESTTHAGTATLVCLTTTTISTSNCPVQSTGPNAGKSTLSCFPTVALYPTCAAGLMCLTDNLGVTTCMKKDNNPGAAGIIIAIVLGSGVLIAVSTMCFFCCRERRTHNRMAKTAEANAIARQAAIDSKRPGAGVRNISSSSGLGGHQADSQPLMPQPPPHSSASSMTMASSHQDYRGGAPSLHHSETGGDMATGPNPFADHQGLR